LLVRIRDSRDERAWGQFVDIYAPLIHGYGRKCGLQEVDAADVTQEVLGVVSRAVRTLDYDPRRGSFRGWLFTIVRNRVRNMLTRAPRERGTGDTGAHDLLREHPDRTEDPDAAWEQEYQRHLFACTAKCVHGRVQDSTWAGVLADRGGG
jgi:RNA polymerase sigma factor (sigma-70 family)